MGELLAQKNCEILCNTDSWPISGRYLDITLNANGEP